jgi:anti-anti-sigma factor
MEQHLRTTSETEGLEPGNVRLRLRGQVTWLHGKQFRAEVDKALRSGLNQIELDFEDLLYLDSTALSEILTAQKLTEESGGRIWITHPRKLIRHIFVSAKLDQVLEIGPAFDPSSKTSDE